MANACNYLTPLKRVTLSITGHSLGRFSTLMRYDSHQLTLVASAREGRMSFDITAT